MNQIEFQEQVTSIIGDQRYSRSLAEDWSKQMAESITDGLRKLSIPDLKYCLNLTVLEKTDKCCQVRSLRLRQINDSLYIFRRRHSAFGMLKQIGK